MNIARLEWVRLGSRRKRKSKYITRRLRQRIGLLYLVSLNKKPEMRENSARNTQSVVSHTIKANKRNERQQESDKAGQHSKCKMPVDVPTARQ